MAEDSRKSTLKEIFADIDPGERELIDNLVDEVVYLEERMTQLKAMPFIAVHPRNPAIQRTTAAARQYKECSQSYMNAIRILLSILNKAETTAQDELLKKLEEFS